MRFWLSDDFKNTRNAAWSFDEIMALDGERFRELDNRRTFRFKSGEQFFFAKLHYGVGWGEIVKNLSQGRLPIISARNEYLAIKHLDHIGVPTMTLAGFGQRGRNPATQQSFVITHELADMISLEDVAKLWAQSPPSLNFRRAVLRALASSAGAIHRSGMNHRDFYLCHFLMPRAQLDTRSPRLHIIDLHRAQIRQHVPRRWLEKDLAGLYFSAMNAGFSRRDLLRFVRLYSQRKLNEADRHLWSAVEKKAILLFKKHYDTLPRLTFFQR